jgi:hypothetical protein
VTFIKIRSHRRKFSNSDSVEQKKEFNPFKIVLYYKIKLSKICVRYFGKFSDEKTTVFLLFLLNIDMFSFVVFS